MSGFDKRREGYESKFAHDEDLKFKATARRNKLLGLWAAEKMGLTGAAADVYAKEVVKADFEEAGDEDVFRKVRNDFDAKKVAVSDHQIRREMEDLMATAVEQISRRNSARARSNEQDEGLRARIVFHSFVGACGAMGRSSRILFIACVCAAAVSAADAGWAYYGGDEGGMRYSPRRADHARQCR